MKDNFKELNGIKIYHDTSEVHSDYNSKGLDTLYREEEKHFWFIARKELILKFIRKLISPKSKVIEIGAGTGNVSRYLMQNGYQDISVGDMHINGLEYAKEYGIKDCYQFNLMKSPFKDEFEAVCMFDVLEHIKDDYLALQNASKMLKKDGHIILTVPSHMWLWNRDDKIASHKIRYTKKSLTEKLGDNGFSIITARYFFISIVPLLYLRTIINKDNENSVEDSEAEKEISINFILNFLLLLICRIENIFNLLIPNIFGGSLLVIARKNDPL